MKNKSIQYAIIFMFCCIITITLCSCHKDEDVITNPIEPPPPIQTIDTLNRYRWHLDTLYGYGFTGMYVADTSNIFFISDYRFIINHSHTFQVMTMQEQSYNLGGISGYDKNNVFFGGMWFFSFGNKIPFLKKWNGSSIQTYYLHDTNNIITNILVNAPNDIWLSMNRNKVYHFFNGNFISYPIDTALYTYALNKDKSNNIYLFAHKLQNISNFTEYRYIFDGGNFVLAGIDSLTLGGYMPPMCNAGNDFLRCGEDNVIRYFENNSWNVLCVAYLFHPMGIGGPSKDSIFVFSQSGPAALGPKIFIRENNKWYVEKNFSNAGFGGTWQEMTGNIVLKNNIVYTFQANGIQWLTRISWLYKGYLKKTL